MRLKQLQQTGKPSFATSPSTTNSEEVELGVKAEGMAWFVSLSVLWCGVGMLVGLDAPSTLAS